MRWSASGLRKAGYLRWAGCRCPAGGRGIGVRVAVADDRDFSGRQDNLKQVDGFGNRFRLIDVDFRAMERVPKLSVGWS